MAATEHINLPSYEQMGRAATALERIAANMDAVSLLGNFATVEDTNTASQSYKAGDYLVLNNLLYKVTSPIASGGNIVIGTNAIQTTVGAEVANYCLYFNNVAVTPTTGDIATVTNASITADHVVAECVWANPSAITTDVTWTTVNGNITLNGACTAATTVNLVLIRKKN
jgi:hypothetical protein